MTSAELLATAAPHHNFVHRFFDWYGWDAFVAIGTIGLALATFVLVRATYRLASQGSAEVRAEWRPVVLVNEDPRKIDYTGNVLDVEFRNVGRGPALDITAELPGFPLPGAGHGSPSGMVALPGTGTGRRGTSLAPGDSVTFHWSGLGPAREGLNGEIRYGDISGFYYETHFSIRQYPENVELVSQRVEELSAIELAWWQRAFPSWMVRPLTERRIRRQFGLRGD